MPNKPDAPKTPATIAVEAPADSPLGQLSLGVLSQEVSLPPRPRASSSPDERSVSKRKRNNILSFAGAIEARRDDKQLLAFSPEEFIRFGLPYKRYPGIEYQRRNGGIRYRITSVPEYGIPFGQDRILPIWLATAYTLCGKPQDGVIRFRAVRDILTAFGLPAGGEQFQTLRERILRLTHATLFVYDERHLEGEAAGDRVALRRYNLIDAVDLWFDKQGRHPNQYTLWQNEITLSKRFAEALREKMMPLDLDTVRALKDKPMALDLYVWQAHRSWELHQRKQPSVGVPVFGEEGLLAQLGSSVSTEFKARQLLRMNQKLVEGVWRGCPNHLTKDGNRLVLRPAEALKDAHLALPGVSSHPPVPRLLASPGAAPAVGRVHVRRRPADEE